MYFVIPLTSGSGAAEDYFTDTPDCVPVSSHINEFDTNPDESIRVKKFLLGLKIQKICKK